MYVELASDLWWHAQMTGTYQKEILYNTMKIDQRQLLFYERFQVSALSWGYGRVQRQQDTILETKRLSFSFSYVIRWPGESHFPFLSLGLCLSKMRRLNSIRGFQFLLEQQNPHYIPLTQRSLSGWMGAPPPPFRIPPHSPNNQGSKEGSLSPQNHRISNMPSGTLLIISPLFV